MTAAWWYLPAPTLATWLLIVILCQAAFVTGVTTVTILLYVRQARFMPLARWVLCMALSYVMLLLVVCWGLYKGELLPTSWRAVLAGVGCLLGDIGLYKLLEARWVRR